MTDNTTATVKAITAEVRQLVVGSRQITASVYNQLDRVGRNEIDPMGRVTPKDGAPGWVYVVGRHRSTGDLVSSSCPLKQESIEQVAVRATDYAMHKRALEAAEKRLAARGRAAEESEHEAERYESADWTSARYHAKTMAQAEAEASAATNEVDRLHALAKAAEARWKAADAQAKAEAHRDTAAEIRTEIAALNTEAERLRQALDQAIQAFRAEHRAITELGREWSALPLIVLAGLR